MSNAYGTDLDLTKIDTSDVDALASKIEAFYSQDSISKSQLAYQWEKNMLMLDGLQWIVYDGSPDSGGQWRRLQPSPQNEYIPRPVTNYMFDVYQTLKSYLLKNRPRSTVSPNTQTNRDKMSAKIAELILECNWERLKEEYNYEYAAGCLVAYGTVFKKDYWDTSYLSQVRIPRMKQQPTMDQMTGQVTGMEEVQDSNPQTGELLYDELPLGDINTCVVEPFRMVLDPLAANMHELRWIMEYSIRPLNWVVENYQKEGEEGYTGKAEEVKAEKGLSNSMRRFFQLKTSSGVRSQYGYPGAAAGSGSYGTDMMVDEAAVVKEYYERPTKKFPKGRLIVVANGITIYAGNSPYSGPEQGDWHPYSECRWEMVPGRFFGKSPLDAVTEIQKQINSIDSIIILTRKTMAVPQKLIPQGSGIAPGTWTGRPGQEIPYRETSEKPSVIPASHVDEQVFIERKQRQEDIKQVSGAIDILKGDRPPGVTAASALALLYEVGTGKLFPILDRWKKFVESSQKKQLRIVSRKYREPRPDFIRMLISKNRDLTEDQLKNFLGDDLYDNCNVVIEAGSSIPKLKAAEHALLLELAPLGVLGLENPQNKKEFLSRFGIQGFDSDYSKDVQRSEWENDLIDNLQYTPDNRPVMLQTDDHNVHVAIHSNRTKEPAFMNLPFMTQKAYFDHIQEHEQAISQQKQMQAIEAASMGQPAAPPAPNPMQQQPNIHPGKGISSKLQQMMMPDVMQGKPSV